MLTDILHIATQILSATAAVYALVYLWVNLSRSYRDAESRKQGLLKVLKYAQNLSLVFTGASVLLAPTGFAPQELDWAAEMFGLHAVTWLAMVVLCGVEMLVLVIRKSVYKAENTAALGKLFKAVLRTMIIALVLSWLLT